MGHLPSVPPGGLGHFLRVNFRRFGSEKGQKWPKLAWDPQGPWGGGYHPRGGGVRPTHPTPRVETQIKFNSNLYEKKPWPVGEPYKTETKKNTNRHASCKMHAKMQVNHARRKSTFQIVLFSSIQFPKPSWKSRGTPSTVGHRPAPPRRRSASRRPSPSSWPHRTASLRGPQRLAQTTQIVCGIPTNPPCDASPAGPHETWSGLTPQTTIVLHKKHIFLRRRRH